MFSVRFVELMVGVDYVGLVKVMVEVKVLEDQVFECVEFYFNEMFMVMFYQEFYVQEIFFFDEKMIVYVCVVVYFIDGNYMEDFVYVNVFDYFEIVEIEYVEFYVIVCDCSGQFVEGFIKEDFSISEDGVL